MAIIVNDKGTLVTSQAGMRLIAQQTLLNAGDAERMRTFIADNYSASALESQSTESRLAELQALGKLRVFQVLAADKHRVIVLMQAQRDEALYMIELAVEEDYPHKITVCTFQPLQEGVDENSGA
jgi:hypothetical protein